MDERENRLLRTEALNFFGAIMAGQSHEATNVLNIINELAGLQGDILNMAEQGRSIDTVKLNQAAVKIQDQVRRGETVIRCMNRFAHSVDCPVTVFDLREALEQIIYLAQRPASLSNTRLDQEFPKESMPLETSPFGLKQAVFYGIEIALAASTEKRRITVSYRLSDKGAEITVASEDPLPPATAMTEKQAVLSLLMRELGGNFVAPAGGDGDHRVVLFFPRPAATVGKANMAPQSRPATEDSHAS
jgi:hypothetical protein